MKTLGILSLIALMACQAEEPDLNLQLAGSYRGTFTRIGPSVDYERAQVSLTLSGGNFEGSSQINNYPAICQGGYLASDSQISFKNTCYWTADFDWTLILDGEFRLISRSDSLVFSRQQGSVVDTYRLKRLD